MGKKNDNMFYSNLPILKVVFDDLNLVEFQLKKTSF